MRRLSTFYRGAQRQRRDFSIPPEWMLNLSSHGAQSRAEYSLHSIRDSYILSATIWEYCDILFGLAQVAVSFYAYC